MGEIEQIKGFKREMFERFLLNLSNFLSQNAIVEGSKVETVYVQKPKETLDSLLAKGVVKIGDRQYLFVAEMNKYGNVELRSKAFWFYLKVEEVVKFLDEVAGK